MDGSYEMSEAMHKWIAVTDNSISIKYLTESVKYCGILKANILYVICQNFYDEAICILNVWCWNSWLIKCSKLQSSIYSKQCEKSIIICITFLYVFIMYVHSKFSVAKQYYLVSLSGLTTYLRIHNTWLIDVYYTDPAWLSLTNERKFVD